MDGKAVSGGEGQDGLFASAVWDAVKKTYIVKVVNTSNIAQPVTVRFTGVKGTALADEARCVTLHSDNLEAENTVSRQREVVPQENSLKLTDGSIVTNVPPRTFAIYTVSKR
jgi:alpha-L-arabinofuranosidase